MFSFSCIEIAGKDALTFLQGQLTADLNSLSAEQSLLAAHASREGRIQSLYLITWQAEAIHLWIPTLLKATGLALLKKYALFSKVVFTDRPDLHLSLVPVDAAPAIQENVLFATLKEEAATFIRLPRTSDYVIKIAEIPIPADSTALTHWIAAEIPWILPETTNLFFAHDLHLPALNAVSFKKGCYLGQEIIARMEYRGKLKRQLRAVRVPQQDWQLGGTLQLDDGHAGRIVLAVEDGAFLRALVVA